MRETFLQNYFEIEKMSFELFFLSSGGHLVQWSGTGLAGVVQGHEMNISVKLF